MKKIPCFLLSFLACSITSAMAEQVAESKIANVTVYPTSASITRTLSVTLPKGSETLVVRGLPGRLDENSLRVKDLQGNALKVGRIDLKNETRSESLLPQIQALQDKLESQQDALSLLKNNDQALATQQLYLQKLAENAGRADVSQGDWQKNLQVLGSGMKEAGAARVVLAKEIREQQKEVDATQRALDSIRNDQTDTKSAYLHLQSNGGAAKISISYQLPDAGWSPVYDADLVTQTSKLHVTQAAYIHQNSGENWDQVSLTLSTLRPSDASEPPPLYSWWIDYRQPRPVARTLMKSVERNEDMAAEVMMAAAPQADTQAVVIDSSYQVSYQISEPVSLASTNEQQRVVIDQQIWPVEMSLKTVPRLDPHAYLFAQIENPSTTPLLAGEWRWLRDGVNVGVSNQPVLTPKAKLDFGFGVDDRVGIDWKTVKDERHEAGVINKQQTLERQYQLKVTNGHSYPMLIAVLDNWPVSKQQDIKVSVLEGTKQPTEQNDQDRSGIQRWMLTVPAGKAVTLDNGYQVQYPQDKQVDPL